MCQETFDMQFETRPTSVLVYEHVSGGGMSDTEIEQAWLDEGRHMRDSAIAAFQSAGCEVITLVDRRLNDNASCTTRVINSVDHLQKTIIELMQQTDYGLCIAPETDLSLFALTELIETRSGWNLGSSSQAVALCGDKHLLSKHLSNHGINQPATWSGDTPGEPWQNHPGPLIVKPRDGAGSIDTYSCSSAVKVRGVIKANPSRFIVQSLAHGKSMSLSAIADGRGGITPIGVCEHRLNLDQVNSGIQSIVSADGRFLPDFAPELCFNSIKALTQIKGLKGWIGVDFIWDSQRQVDTFIEINPRLTMAFCWISQRIPSARIIGKWLEIVTTPHHNGQQGPISLA
jgi:tyramine---L-glutamate ligase